MQRSVHCIYYESLSIVYFVEYSASKGRPVGWSGDGGVRETMRVELTSGGGAFLHGVWGSAVSSPSGSGAEPQQLCNFYNVEVTKHRIIA